MADDKRQALGRGLESLLPARHAPPRPAPANTHASDSVRELPVGLIERNPYQTRSQLDEVALAELAASITASGVIQPVVVRPLENGRFQLIAGERRWMASQRAGKATVPAIVKHVSNAQAMEMTIIENLQREDLNPMEQARAFERLGREFSLTQEQMAQRTGKDRTTITNYLRLLKLPPYVQEALVFGRLTFGHAKALLALDSTEQVVSMARKVVMDSLSVRRTEELVSELKNPTRREPKLKPLDPNVRQAQQELERALGVRVEIRDRKGRGRIVIRYNSLEDFDRVVAALAE
jgi:ParB family transcriptional regulator, chromosome partitioning protein